MLPNIHNMYNLKFRFVFNSGSKQLTRTQGAVGIIWITIAGRDVGRVAVRIVAAPLVVLVHVTSPLQDDLVMMMIDLRSNLRLRVGLVLVVGAVHVACKFVCQRKKKTQRREHFCVANAL